MELWGLKPENTSGRPHFLSVWSYAEFSYHQIPIDNQNFQMSVYCAGNSYADGIIDYELFHEHARQFMASSFRPDGFDCLRDSFTGPYRTEATPRRWSRGHVLAPLRRETTTAPCCKKGHPCPRGIGPAGVDAGRGRLGGGPPHPGQVQRFCRCRRGLFRPGPALGGQAVPAPGVHPPMRIWTRC